MTRTKRLTDAERAEIVREAAGDIVERYHGEICRQWGELGMSWDLYTTTGTKNAPPNSLASPRKSFLARPNCRRSARRMWPMY